MRAHEYPYLDKPAILEFPNETWSAQDMRKSDLLAWAALCESGIERQAFLAASRGFFEDVLTRLPGFSTSSYTRPTVLMLTRGYTLPWAAAHGELHVAAAPVTDAHPPKLQFEAQRIVAIRRAKLVLLVAGFLTVALVAVAIYLVYTGRP